MEMTVIRRKKGKGTLHKQMKEGTKKTRRK